VLYKTYARKETHPGRIGALGRLYGLDAAPASSCKLLEVACGNGLNIIPLALQYPDSFFVGIDSNQELIEQGMVIIKELELTNIVLECVSIESYHPTISAYDYVVCHGLYSWVDSQSQEAILQRGVTALKEHGVFYVSYNTLPGWRQRGVVRDILLYGASLNGHVNGETPYERAVAFANIIEQCEEGVSPYVKEALGKLSEASPSYVIQEFLGQNNEPILFSTFMQAATNHGLQYLSECRVVMMSTDDLGDGLKELLRRCGEDRIAQEQIIDIARNRTFRETLLCHESASLTEGLPISAFKELYFISKYVPMTSPEIDKGDLREGGPFKERFLGKEIVLPTGECTALLRVIDVLGVFGVSYQELEETAITALGCSAEQVLQSAVTLWRSGFIDLLCEPLVTQRGQESLRKLMKRQLENGDKVTSPLHESYAIEGRERSVLGAVVECATGEERERLVKDTASTQAGAEVLHNLRCIGLL
jgi:hypothetical protein